MFTDNNYFVGGNTFIMPLILSIIMLIVGYCNAHLFNIEFLEELAKIYIFATVLLCLDVYFEYLQGVSLSTVTYAFSAKNSVGQMILTAIVLLLYLYKPKGIKKIIKYVVLIFFLVIIVLMRSRASIASLVIIPLVYILNSKIRLRYRVLISIFIIAILIVILLNKEVYDFIIRNILLNTTDGQNISFNDLNRITSNRFEYLDLFNDIFPGNELTGVGFMYIDNMFLSAILNYGIFIGTLVILFALYPIFVVLFQKEVNLDAKMVIKTIAFTYFVNAFFEGLAPFGPGTKCFFLWFIIGSICNKNSGLIDHQSVRKGYLNGKQK